MGNLQSFENIFEINFPTEIADQILGRIQNLYLDQFDKRFGDIDSQELLQIACSVFSGLTPQDITRGLQRMNSEKWCPTLPEFRSWCVSGSDWWTADQAWAKSLNFINDRSKPITTLAKASLDEVRLILDAEGQKAAHYAFRDIYEDYLQKAKALGRVQTFWTEPKALQLNSALETDHGHKPIKVDVHQMMQQAYAKAGRTH